MTEFKFYAINKTSALKQAKILLEFNDWTSSLGSSQCACGETPTLFLYHSSGDVARIIICEACFVDAALLEQAPVYFDEDVTREILEERYNKAVENGDFVVVGDQEYNPETIRVILERNMAVMYAATESE